MKINRPFSLVLPLFFHAFLTFPAHAADSPPSSSAETPLTTSIAPEPAGGASAAPLETPAPPPPAPYSLPFQLRPAQAVSVVRSDSSLAFYEGPTGEGGTTFVSSLLASYKVTPAFSPLVRAAIAYDSSPAGVSGFTVSNPLVGGVYGFTLLPELRLALFLGLTIPIGSGGGDAPDPSQVAANGAAMRARAALDNALFASNDFTLFPGVSLAYVAHGLTVQLELNVLQLTRVRGELAQPDSSRTNFTGGLHVAYFFAPFLSAGVELRHQRWLSTPAAVELNEALRDTTTLALGPRFHIPLAKTVWARPALTYSFALDDPLQASKYSIVQLDIPVLF